MKKLAKFDGLESAFLGKSEQYERISYIVGVVAVTLFVISFFVSFEIQISLLMVFFFSLVAAGNMYNRSVFLKEHYEMKMSALSKTDVVPGKIQDESLMVEKDVPFEEEDIKMKLPEKVE